jgi:crotonobetainyl-CoA:carnitine CoA-transferase CaiB-like acyl-CoA transferase
VFDTADGEQVFVGVVSDAQWLNFCRAFDRADWANDLTLALNNQRVRARDTLLPEVRALFAALSKAELLRRCEAANLPFAPITRPDELAEDPHLLASEGMVSVTAKDGVRADLPNLPLRMDRRRSRLYQDVPTCGQHTRDILFDVLGLDSERVDALVRARAVA